MTCKEKILSENYLDLLADYDVMLKYGEVEGADYCYQKIDEELYVVYSSKEDVPNYYEDPQQLLDELKPDFVAVCTPNIPHKEWNNAKTVYKAFEGTVEMVL